ncbi:MAG: hypothetical protein RJA07_329 [Bacteroidota bacterium]|jgi:hypothetical protein
MALIFAVRKNSNEYKKVHLNDVTKNPNQIKILRPQFS